MEVKTAGSNGEGMKRSAISLFAHFHAKLKCSFYSPKCKTYTYITNMQKIKGQGFVNIAFSSLLQL